MSCSLSDPQATANRFEREYGLWAIDGVRFDGESAVGNGLASLGSLTWSSSRLLTRGSAIRKSCRDSMPSYRQEIDGEGAVHPLGRVGSAVSAFRLDFSIQASTRTPWSYDIETVRI